MAWPVASELIDPIALRAWMDGRHLGSGELTNAALLVGGTQNFLMRFNRSDVVYVLRRPPEHKRKNIDETMRRESRVLAALAGSDVPHPAFIAGEPSLEVIGAAFFLMDHVDGFLATSEGLPQPHASDPALQHRMGLSMVEAIAALGAIDHEAVGLADFGKPGYLERQVPRWRGQLESYSQLAGYTGVQLPAADELGDWLEAHRPKHWKTGIIHGDFHIANVLFSYESGDLAAVVDWELATIGDPLIDLGQLLAMWPSEGNPASLHGVNPGGFCSSDDLLHHYADNSERDLSNID